MTTGTAAFRRGIRLGNGHFGHIFPITSLTTTTAVCDVLKIGEASSKYVNGYIVRRGSVSTADRIRQVTDFNGTTGTFTHAGTNYSDTTATGEYVEWYPFSPLALDQYAMRVLPECRRYHRDVIPANGSDTYYLDQQSWITKRGHVQRVLHGGRDLNRNATFDDWNTVSTAGLLEPDAWTKTGAGSTWSRAATNPYRGPYELSLTRSGTNAVMTQAVMGMNARGLLGDGVNSMIGETVGVLAIVRGPGSGELRAFIDDGPTTTLTSYYTAAGAHQLLETSVVVGAAATELTVGITLEVDATYFVSELHLVRNAIDDGVRHGNDQYADDGDFGWLDRPPAFKPNHRLSRGQSYLVESWRPFPALDETRLIAGSADSDESDIDVTLWAWGIMTHAYEGADPEHYTPFAREARHNYESLRGGAWDMRPSTFRRRPLGPALRRV